MTDLLLGVPPCTSRSPQRPGAPAAPPAPCCSPRADSMPWTSPSGATCWARLPSPFHPVRRGVPTGASRWWVSGWPSIRRPTSARSPQSGVAVATVVTMGATPVFTALGSRFLLGSAWAARTRRAGDGAGRPAPPHRRERRRRRPGRWRPAAGIGLALVSAAGYAAVTLFSRRHRDDPQRTAMGGFAVGRLPRSLRPGRRGAAGSGVTWRLLLYLGVVPTALAYGLFFRALTALEATTVSIVSLGEAVGAAVLGVVLFGERLAPRHGAAARCCCGRGGPGGAAGSRGDVRRCQRDEGRISGRVSGVTVWRPCYGLGSGTAMLAVPSLRSPTERLGTKGTAPAERALEERGVDYSDSQEPSGSSRRGEPQPVQEDRQGGG